MANLIIIEKKPDGTETTKVEAPINKKKLPSGDYEKVYLAKVKELQKD